MGRPSTTARALRERRPLRLLERALHDRRPVRGTYHGQALLLSPHALGRHAGELFVLAFAVLPEARHAAPVRWRWMRVEELQDLTLHDGPWLTAPGRPSSDFLDRILAEVDLLPEDAEPALPTF